MGVAARRSRRPAVAHPLPGAADAFPGHALVAAYPETGRQHQIRVHLASIGHPIVGDKLYRASEEHFIDFCDGGHDRRSCWRRSTACPARRCTPTA